MAADVEVVLTVRDAARTMPAQWQTTCRNGSTLPWPRFARGIGAWLEHGRDTRSAACSAVPRMSRRCSRSGPASSVRDRVRVVTVPPSGADPLLLWRRFAEAAGIDPSVVVDPDVRRNPSLGHPSCELLRRVNEVLEGNAARRRGAGHPGRGRARPGDPVRPRAAGPPRRSWPGGRRRVEPTGARCDRSRRRTVIGDLDDLPPESPADAPAPTAEARPSCSPLPRLHDRA